MKDTDSQNSAEKTGFVKKWGFDPDQDKIWIRPGNNYYYYENFFDLKGDPQLSANGFQLGARTFVFFWDKQAKRDEQGQPRKIYDDIVIKLDQSYSSISCYPCIIPVGKKKGIPAIWDTEPIKNVKDIKLRAQLEQFEPIFLSPEDHFLAVRSYTAALAEFGIQNFWRECLAASTDATTPLPIWFSGSLVTRIFRKILLVSPGIGSAFLADLLLPWLPQDDPAWYNARHELLDEWTWLPELAALQPGILEKIWTTLDFPKFAQFASHFCFTHPDVLRELSTLKTPEIRRAVVAHPNTPADVLNTLLAAGEENPVEWVHHAEITPRESIALARLEFWIAQAMQGGLPNMNPKQFYAIRARDEHVVSLKVEDHVDNAEWTPHCVEEGEEQIDLEDPISWRVKQGLALLKIKSNIIHKCTPIQLETLLACLGDFPRLEDLMLHPYTLEALPDEVGLLPHLARLDVAHNYLARLPETLGDLGSLRELVVSYNWLEAWPASLGRLRRLERLEAVHAGKAYLPLPPALLDLPALQEVVVGEPGPERRAALWDDPVVRALFDRGIARLKTSFKWGLM